MSERAIFLDRDNTIIDNDGYLGDPAKVKLLTGASAALAALRALGYRLIVVSNQSGVARGMFGEADVEAVNQEMCRQLKEQAHAHIDASYYCPYHPEAVVPAYKLDHDWRKPKAGMLLQAAADFSLDLSQCWMIGDQSRDIAAGTAAGCRTILLRDPDHSIPDTDSPGQAAAVSPNFIIKNLADAARIVAREGKHHQPAPAPAPAPTRPAVSDGTGSSAPVSLPAPAPSSSSLDGSSPRSPTAPPVPPSPGHPTISSRIEKTLEDLVSHLRHQSRLAEMPRDFSRARFAAILVQVFAILALFVGFYHLVSASAALKDWNLAYATLYRGIIWTLVAVFLQLLTLTLLLISKDK